MSMGLYFDRQGKPMTMDEWARRHADRDYMIVAQHWVRGWMVSTVWLGIDHGHGYSKLPVIFETMVFPPGDAAPEGDGIMSEQYQERYSTEQAAQAGHDRALAWVREKLGDDAAMDILSAAQFSDPADVPDDPSALT